MTDLEPLTGQAGTPPREEEPDGGGGELESAAVLVPDGEYELSYRFYETASYFGEPRVFVHFWITHPEEYAGLPLLRYYNVKQLKEPPKKYGRYVVKPTGDLVREFAIFAPDPKRLDRISFQVLRDQKIVGLVETVSVDRNDDPIPRCLQYSKIKKLVRSVPGDDW